MKAIAIGSIGALTETSEIQRQCFNQALAEFDTGLAWNVATYCEAITKPGGLKRLTSMGLSDAVASAVHQRKQTLYKQAIQGAIHPRDGIVELMAECKAQQITMAFLTTTTKATLDAIETALGDVIDFDQFALITTADMVSAPKPAADVYRMALSELACAPQDMLVIEDTEANIGAANKAGVKTLFTPGEYALVSSMKAHGQAISFADCADLFKIAA